MLLSVLAVSGAVGLVIWGYVRMRDNERGQAKKDPSPPVVSEKAVRSAAVRARTCAHETGHTIVAWYSKHILSVDQIVIGQDEEGVVYAPPAYDVKTADTSALIEHAILKMAGCAGDLLLFSEEGFVYGGAVLDMMHALQAITLLIRRHESDLLVSRLNSYIGIPRPRFYIIDSSLTPLEVDCLAAAYLEARQRIIEHIDQFEELWEMLVLMGPGTMSAQVIAAFFGEPRHWAPK